MNNIPPRTSESADAATSAVPETHASKPRAWFSVLAVWLCIGVFAGLMLVNGTESWDTLAKFVNRSYLYAYLGEPDLAAKDWQRALEIDPTIEQYEDELDDTP